MKLLFIIPPNISFENFINPSITERTTNKNGKIYGDIKVDMPLGILSMSAYLKKNVKDIEIELIDFNIILNEINEFEFRSYFKDLYIEQILKIWRKKEFKPDIVAISSLFSTGYNNLLDVAYISRNIFPLSCIIAGGGIPTNLYEKIFNDSISFDALCFGEGEKPLLELIKSEDKRKLFESHKSWITKEKIKNDEKFEFDFIEDLDEIPTFDYDLIDINKYNKNSLHTLFPLLKDEKSISVISSRGCTHYCVFCSSHTVHGRYIREYSIERIKEDIKVLKKKYNVKVITFFDDHFLFNKDKALEILIFLKSENLKAFFPSSLALYALSEDILKALKDVGVDNLILSVESGSDKVLREIMHKPLNLNIVKKVIERCNKLDIATDISILIGFPGETKQDIEDTRQFLKTLNANWYRISVATPLVGSEMFDICLKNNYIKGDYISCDFKRAIVETPDFTPEWLQEKAYELNLELNFVENNDMKSGNYSNALKEFENVIKVKNDHALAYYYASICYLHLDEIKKHFEYREKYELIVRTSDFWKNYAKKFELRSL